MAELEARLSAREFSQWLLWMDAEQVGPAWDTLRHAQLLAALHNGPMSKRDKSAFKASEFVPANPWAPPGEAPPPPDPTDDFFRLLDAAEG